MGQSEATGSALFRVRNLDWSGDWSVRETNRTTALAWLPRYHYSGNIGHTGASFYGIFSPDLIAVIGIGPPTNPYGLARRFGLGRWRGNREITRVAVHPDAPRNSASRSIALAARFVHRLTDIEWLFAYADTGQGHHGGIYQALNALYVGMNVGGAPPPSWEIRISEGWQPIAARTLQKKCGTARVGAIERLATMGVEARIVAVEKPAKHSYILPIGSPATRRAIREHLRAYALPYPKRFEPPSRGQSE